MIDGIALPQIGLGLGWAVAFVFTIAVLRGLLVPRRTLDDQIHETNEWRTESRIKDQQIAEKDEQLRELSEVAALVNAVMRAIQRGPRSEPPEEHE